MSKTISQNSKELFVYLAEKHFHNHQLDHQFWERNLTIKMLIDYGEKEKAKELTVLL